MEGESKAKGALRNLKALEGTLKAAPERIWKKPLPFLGCLIKKSPRLDSGKTQDSRKSHTGQSPKIDFQKSTFKHNFCNHRNANL